MYVNYLNCFACCDKKNLAQFLAPDVVIFSCSFATFILQCWFYYPVVARVAAFETRSQSCASYQRYRTISWSLVWIYLDCPQARSDFSLLVFYPRPHRDTTWSCGNPFLSRTRFLEERDTVSNLRCPFRTRRRRRTCSNSTQTLSRLRLGRRTHTEDRTPLSRVLCASS